MYVNDQTSLPLADDPFGPGQVIPDDDKPFLAIRNSLAAGDTDHALDLIADLSHEEFKQWELLCAAEEAAKPPYESKPGSKL